jgi:hypothetical protein
MNNHTDTTTTHDTERGDGMTDAQRYSNGQRDYLEAIEELLGMDADMLRAACDVLDGGELDDETLDTPVDASSAAWGQAHIASGADEAGARAAAARTAAFFKGEESGGEESGDEER